MSDLQIGGVSVWRTQSESGSEGIDIANQATDDTPCVSVYIHAGDIIGCIVRDDNRIVARWGFVDAESAV